MIKKNSYIETFVDVVEIYFNDDGSSVVVCLTIEVKEQGLQTETSIPVRYKSNDSFHWEKLLPFTLNKLSIMQLITMLSISSQLEHCTDDSYSLMRKYIFPVTADMLRWQIILQWNDKMIKKHNVYRILLPS